MGIKIILHYFYFELLKFNTGETIEVDLRDLVYKYPIAKPLRSVI